MTRRAVGHADPEPKVHSPTAGPLERDPDVPPFVDVTGGIAGPSLHPDPYVARHDAPPNRHMGLVLVGILIVLAGLAGAGYLRVHLRPDTSGEVGVQIPGTDLLVDKPSGWTGSELGDAPSLVELFLDDPGVPPLGLVFRREESSIFVVHVPNPTGIDTVPEFPSTLGDLKVVEQSEVIAPLGKGRRLVVEGETDGAYLTADSTVLLVADKILVIGVVTPDGIGWPERGALDDVTESLRPG